MNKDQWLVGIPNRTADLSNWAHILSPILGRSSDEIQSRRLNIYDFEANAADVEIIFPDDSTACFRNAFFMVDETLGRVGVFTEHCGYWDMSAWGLRITAGDQSFVDLDE